MSHGTLNILIADDDEGDRRQIRRALRQAGLSCEYVEAASVEEALEACRGQAFDCAFVDYRMPGHDGLNGMTSLHERLPDLPIIMATGQGDEMVATEAMKRGASDYIPKMHVHAASLRRIVENALEVAALRRKLALQQQELENFAAVLVHDLRAPIASIRAFAHFIEQALRSETADKKTAIDHCRRVVAAGARMGTLIDTLYEYTRADARVTFEPVEIRRVMEVTLFNLAHTIRERRAQVTHGELPAVIGNFAQLVQLLQNLIGNGIKYSEAACPAVSVTGSPDRDGAWLIAVKDNGIGIPQEHYQDIFEPFKRLHGRGKFEGTGLGLATCKKIVERHGGAIRCVSREGEGTTFYFTLRGAGGDA
jgi:light-regulated signal transduction histidine kinase (bacteriophytochrome)